MEDTSASKLEEKLDRVKQEELQETLLDDFCAMMKGNGPVVRALLLKADGSVVEVNYDSTPRNDHISIILGGSPTIVGELPGEPDGVILTKKYLPDATIDFPNQHSILAPYGPVLGDVFATRLDEKVQPQHFGLLEWELWMSNYGNTDPDKILHFEGDKEADGIEVHAEDETEEEVDAESAIMYSIVNAYMAKNGGTVPTAEQVADILDRMGFNVIDNLTVEEEKEYLIEAYEKEYGVKPTAEQLEHLMQKLPITKAAQLISMEYPDEDNDEDYIPTDQEEEEYDMEVIAAQAQSMVMDFPDVRVQGNKQPDHKIDEHKNRQEETCEREPDRHQNEVVGDFESIGSVENSGQKNS